MVNLVCCNCKHEASTYQLESENNISSYMFLGICPKCNAMNIELWRITLTGEVLPVVTRRGKKALKLYDKLEKSIIKEVTVKLPKGTNCSSWRYGEYLKTKAFSTSMDGCRQENAFRNDRIEMPELKVYYEEVK